MSKLTIGVIGLVCSIMAYAATESSAAIEAQHTDQTTCYDTRLAQCMQKCPDDNACQACAQNAKDECREAGE